MLDLEESRQILQDEYYSADHQEVSDEDFEKQCLVDDFLELGEK